MRAGRRRVVVVANRLPVAWHDKTETWRVSPGGLVSALTPILQETSGTWVGWSGVPDRAFESFEYQGIEQVPIHLSRGEYEDFYVGFCNGTLWPLYHDALRTPQYHRHWWAPYQQVNRKFATAAAEHLGRHDVVWVQDYQLQLVPGMVRELRPNQRIGFYLHIPFPPIELFSNLPWRRQVLEGLLASDVIAFQSRSSRTNFSVAARRLVGARGTSRSLEWEGREVTLQVAPIGIDAEGYRDLARAPTTSAGAAEIRRRLGEPDVVILGVDRLDYTKGIDHRMRALQTMLENQPDLVGRVAFIQIAVPSREDVAEYKRIRTDIEALVGRINGDVGRLGSQPIHYLYRSFPSEELVSYYRAADVMLVTPLRDGMNLVAKEYIATRYDNTGVLILSEFAGASEQLTRALVVNPHDLNGLAATMAVAITMSPDDQERRMRALRRSVAQHDVFWWAEQCLAALEV